MYLQVGEQLLGETPNNKNYLTIVDLVQIIFFFT